MGRAIELPADQDQLKSHPKLTFEADGYSYAIERKGDRSIYTVRDATGELSLPIDWAFGAGRQNFLFLYQGHFYESMVSYYPELDGISTTLGDLELKPHNLIEAMGREVAGPELIECFRCHSTGGATDGRLTLASFKPGVACEHCHAGAEQHMRDIVRGKTASVPEKLGQRNAEDMSNFCGQCHRTWDFIVRSREWGKVNVRFEPYRLANSRCFLGNDKRIRCTACHDPHDALAKDEVKYDRACLSCHGQKTFASCTVGTRSCVSCHMPKVTLSDGHHVFTDHEIRVVRDDSYPD